MKNTGRIKSIISIICIVIIAICLFIWTFNKQKEENQVVLNSQFGEFGYNGSTLTDYAIKTITANEAKELLNFCQKQLTNWEKKMETIVTPEE